MKEFELNECLDIRFYGVIVSSWYVVYYYDNISYISGLILPIRSIDNENILFDYDKKVLGKLIGLFKFDDNNGNIIYYTMGKKHIDVCKTRIKENVRFFVLSGLKM